MAMKKGMRIIVTLAGVGALIAFCYNGPIQEIANAFKKEVSYYFSITPESAMASGGVGKNNTSTDYDSLAQQVISDIEISDDVDKPDWDMNNAAGEVYGQLTEELPFIEKVGNWIEEFAGKLGFDVEIDGQKFISGGGSEETEEGSAEGNSEEGTSAE